METEVLMSFLKILQIIPHWNSVYIFWRSQSHLFMYKLWGFILTLQIVLISVPLELCLVKVAKGLMQRGQILLLCKVNIGQSKPTCSKAQVQKPPRIPMLLTGISEAADWEAVYWITQQKMFSTFMNSTSNLLVYKLAEQRNTPVHM